MINAFFKFLAPQLLDIQLDRTAEMMLGVGLPVSLLALIEIYSSIKKTEPQAYLDYQNQIKAQESTAVLHDEAGNKRGAKVIGLGVVATGLLVFPLSFMAATGAFLVAGMGVLVLVLGTFIIYRNR